MKIRTLVPEDITVAPITRRSALALVALPLLSCARGARTETPGSETTPAQGPEASRGCTDGDVGPSADLAGRGQRCAPTTQRRAPIMDSDRGSTSDMAGS